MSKSEPVVVATSEESFDEDRGVDIGGVGFFLEGESKKFSSSSELSPIF